MLEAADGILERLSAACESRPGWLARRSGWPVSRGPRRSLLFSDAAGLGSRAGVVGWGSPVAGGVGWGR
ncbi:MAG: hypothetical protein WAL72_36630, partial [Streptosporangiaceae bacterium]